MKRSHLFVPIFLAATLGSTTLRTAGSAASFTLGAARTYAKAGGESATELRRVRGSEAVSTAAGSLASVIMPIGESAEPTRDTRGLALVRHAIRVRGAGTYIGEMLMSRDSALARWPERRDNPIRVWIQTASTVSEWTPLYIDQVKQAFLDWDAIDLPVRFKFVEKESDAEVVVYWIDHFQEPISGRTKWARDGAYWITDASIALAVHHREGEVLDEDAMKAMALHEIGHLLGLDHTADPTSIMAPRVRVRDLSLADRATAKLLYSLPPGMVR